MQLTSLHSFRVLTGIAMFAFSGFAGGAIVTQTFSSTPNAVVPDNNLSGLADTISVSTAMTSVDKVTVTIETTGGWSGDLYAYLHFGGDSVVLLNRVGRTAGTPAGASASSMTVTLDDAGLADIHNVSVGATSITGTYQPDGRTESPLTATDTSPRTTSLADFVGANPTGNWSLFIADLATGDEATLVSWSVSLTGDVIPEPSAGILAALALMTALRRRR